jgi:uncharacterized protein (TIGR02246 family)
MIRSIDRTFSAVALIACLGMLTGLAHAAPKDADQAALRAQTIAWEKAYNGGDPKGVAAQYAEDALLMPPGSPGVRGRAAILAFFTKDVADSKAGGVTFTINTPTEVGVSGNMGWESGTYKATVKGAVVETGKFLSVSRKQDGKWLYIRDTWNADAPSAPPPTPAPPPPAMPPARK